MVIIVERDKDGKIVLTDEELNKIVDEAEKAGRDSVRLVPYYPDYYPYYPYHYVDYFRPSVWWEYQPTCTGIDPYKVNISSTNTSNTINSKDYNCNGTETTAHFTATSGTKTEVKADNE